MQTLLTNRANALIVFVLSFFLGTAVNAFAERDAGHMRGDKQGWEDKVNKMYDKLDLNEEQKAKLKGHKEAHREEMKVLRDQIKAKREEIRKEMEKADFDVNKVRAINNELKSLENNMADQRLEGILEVRGILTPEQFSKFNELKEEHKGEWRDKLKERRGPEKDRKK